MSSLTGGQGLGDNYLTRTTPGSVEIDDADTALNGGLEVCSRSNKIDHFRTSTDERSARK